MNSTAYWENETPIIVRTERHVFRLYELAGRLQVCMPDYEGKSGRTMPGKTVGIHIKDVKSSEEAKALIRKALAL